MDVDKSWNELYESVTSHVKNGTSDVFWDRIKKIVHGSSVVGVIPVVYTGITYQTVSLTYGKSVYLEAIRQSGNGISMINIFIGGGRLHNVTPEEAETYVYKLAMLPAPTLHQCCSRANYTTIHKDRKYLACDEYVLIDYEMIVMRGDLITVNGNTFPYTFENLGAA
jgi:hypothetical protein